jgi:hypothetical protein
MKCKSQEVNVKGAVYNAISDRVSACNFRVLCTNDENGKTLSIDNGHLQFSIPMEEVAKYFEGDYRKGKK